MSQRSAMRSAVALVACLLASWLPAIWVATDATPYVVRFLDVQYRFLWRWLGWLDALCVLSIFSLCLGPGLLLVAALGRGSDFGRWLLEAAGLTLVGLPLLTSAAQALVPGALVGSGFVLLLLGLAALAAAALLVRVARGSVLTLPAGDSGAGQWLLMLVPLFALIWLFLPKLAHESFNPDGVHAFETGRLLLHQPLPLWGPGHPWAAFPGITSMVSAYPVSWCIRILGEQPIAARAPFFLALLLLHAATLALARQQGRALHPVEQLLVWLSLSSYAVFMAWSATYSPYSADLAMPGAQDTLLVVTFLGFVLAFVRRERVWLLLFLVLTFLGLPSGSLLLGSWIAGSVLLERPRPWRMVLPAAIALALCVVANAALAAGGESAAEALRERFRFLLLTDWRRLLWVMVPCGLVPAAAIVLGWRGTPATRVLTLVTTSYVVLVYVQGFVVPHDLVPGMLLLLAGWWMLAAAGPPQWWLPSQWWLPGLVAAGGVFGLWLSLPADLTVDTTTERIASRIRDLRPGYEEMRSEVFRSARLLYELFPAARAPDAPERAWGASCHGWQYHARHWDGRFPDANYVLQPDHLPPPAGATLVRRDFGAALYVRDPGQLESDRALRPGTDKIARIYRFDRDLMFGPRRPGPDNHLIDVAALLHRLGLR